MKAVRRRDRGRQSTTLDLGGTGCVFLWAQNGFRRAAGPDMEIEIPSDPPVYGQSMGLRARRREDAIAILKNGLPVSSFEKLHKEMKVSSSELARFAHISIRTLQRRRQQGRFQTDESERLLRIGVLFDQAVDVLGGAEAARAWLRAPKKPLAGKSPLEYCDTEPGAREVEDLLGRIAHGVFS
jgi:putative toxin-antitoxin system antitoxin component (TIGR02293 family)